MRIKAPERWNRWKRSLRLAYIRLLRLKGQPEEVAGGVAIGVFVGMTPTVPLHTILSILIAFILGKSKLAAALGAWVANPFVLPFIYILDYKVGRIVTRTNPPSFVLSDFSISHLLELGWDISLPMIIGGFITGVLFSIPSYFITKRIIILYRIKKRKKLEKVDFTSKKD